MADDAVAARLRSLQVKPKTPPVPKVEMTEVKFAETLQNTKDEAAQETRTAIMREKFVQEHEDEHHAQLLESIQPPRKRGRPRKDGPPIKDTGPPPAVFAAPKPAPKKAMPKIGAHNPTGDSGWTDEGKDAKRRALAIMKHPRLSAKVGPVDMPMMDSDQGWMDALADMKRALASVNAEANAQDAFVSTISGWEAQAVQGRLNPLGLAVGGLKDEVVDPVTWDSEFNDDIAELSIDFDWFFSSGPLMRLATKTAKVIGKVHLLNSLPIEERLKTPVSVAEANKFAGL